MKFLVPLALFAVAGVSAQDKKCEAGYIVERCLTTETPKIKACDPLDYDCQCAAYQAVATCYTNCPKDERAFAAQNQVVIMCQNASLYGSKAQAEASKTAAVTGSQTSVAAAASTTADDEEKDEEKDDSKDDVTDGAKNAEQSTAPAASSSTAAPEGSAANIARNTGGLLLAVAGVVAAML